MAFCPKNEKWLAMLTCNPVQTLFLFQWDKPKMILMLLVNTSATGQMGNQVSFSTINQNYIFVTGQSTYMFYTVQADQSLMGNAKKTLNKKEQHISNNYTCHCWLQEGKFLIGTDQGYIIICDGNGDYKGLVQ